MASTSEVGSAKQLAEFEDFVNQLTALGTVYNPPKPELAFANLKEQLTSAKNAMREISSAIPPYSTAVDKQTLAFKSLNDKITRSLNYYKVCIVNPEEIDTAKSLADKIRGVSKKAKIAIEGAVSETKKVSQSQMSYDSRIENLKQYIDVLTASGVYTSPGSGIELSDLAVLLKDMEESNRMVTETKAPLDLARNKRDGVLYTPKAGIADLVTNVKRYLKATLPKDNPHYNALAGFAFKKRA